MLIRHNAHSFITILVQVSMYFLQQKKQTKVLRTITVEQNTVRGFLVNVHCATFLPGSR